MILKALTAATAAALLALSGASLAQPSGSQRHPRQQRRERQLERRSGQVRSMTGTDAREVHTGGEKRRLQWSGRRHVGQPVAVPLRRAAAPRSRK